MNSLQTVHIREHVEQAVTGWARVAPDLDVVTMRTALLFARVATLGMKHVESAFEEVGLSVGEFDVLASLILKPDHTSTPSDLARSGMMSPAGMTHRLDILEKAEFIERHPDPDDRRSTLVVLTKTGQAKAMEGARQHVAAESELFQQLNQRDLADLRRVLETMLDTHETITLNNAELSH